MTHGGIEPTVSRVRVGVIVRYKNVPCAHFTVIITIATVWEERPRLDLHVV